MWPRFQARLDVHYLPELIREIVGQETVPFGEGIIVTLDSCIGFEICEEFFVSNAPHITMSSVGVEIFSNGSASHYELGKWARKSDLIQYAMTKTGGIYLYSNALGCDGDRVYYDGGSLIISNERIVARDGLFGFEDVIITMAEVDLEEVRTFRGKMQSMAKESQFPQVEYPRIAISFALSSHSPSNLYVPKQLEPLPVTEEEMLIAPAMWLFDYLKLSGAVGFFLPLSGGLDSCSVALIVHRLAEMLADEYDRGCKMVVEFVRSRLCLKEIIDAEAICHQLLITCYMKNANSTLETQQLAADIGRTIGSTHLEINLGAVISALSPILVDALGGFCPHFRVEGGSIGEDLALQNIQARLRMIVAYALAQLSPIPTSRPGPMLVLATSNASECLRGYYTKYDSSSGDLNPIGSLDKEQLRAMIRYVSKVRPTMSNLLESILQATPSAELTPLHGGKQSDEAEMGLTYTQLSLLGSLRQQHRLGPFGMQEKLNEMFRGEEASNSELVKRFFYHYSINRHKASTLPPTFHATPSNPDGTRHDMRPIIYPRNWATSFGYKPL